MTVQANIYIYIYIYIYVCVCIMKMDIVQTYVTLLTSYCNFIILMNFILFWSYQIKFIL